MALRGILGTVEKLIQDMRGLWDISKEYSIDIRRNQERECPVTIPQLRGHQLLGVIIEHPNDISQDQDTILHHEGAHTHLFCNRGYPPTNLASMDNIEIIAEYYASKMEMEKRFPTQSDREAEPSRRVEGCYGEAVSAHFLNNRDLKRVAIKAAVYVQICKDWGLYDSQRIVSARTLEGNLRTVSTSTLGTVYSKAAAILQRAPREFQRTHREMIENL